MKFKVLLIQIEKGTDTQKKYSVRKKFKQVSVCLTMCRELRKKEKGYIQLYKINIEDRHTKIPRGKGNRQDYLSKVGVWGGGQWRVKWEQGGEKRRGRRT